MEDENRPAGAVSPLDVLSARADLAVSLPSGPAIQPVRRRRKSHPPKAATSKAAISKSG
jgi:hypothetical protein